MFLGKNTLRLDNVLKSLNYSSFEEIAIKEIEQLNPELLPLQQGLSQGSYVADEPIKAIIIGYTEEQNNICLKAGIFYSSVIAGCSCADDPTPIDIIQEYCELEFKINEASGEAVVNLVTES